MHKYKYGVPYHILKMTLTITNLLYNQLDMIMFQLPISAYTKKAFQNIACN